jgi:hypothetical protein
MAPSIHYVKDAGYWEVRYAGMVRRHAQDWQAYVWFQMALAMYAVSAYSSSHIG